jgi:hypothetical protein
MSEYIHKSHNVTVLLYHLVFPAKYRRAVFDNRVDEVLKEVCLEIAERYQVKCVFRGSWTRVSHEGGQVFRAKLDSRSAATQGVSVFTLTAGFRSN